MHDKKMLQVVEDRYARVARSNISSEMESIRNVARAFGYSQEELASLPDQSNMGLSCGNPTAVAGLREGEVVVDLGCGGGLDVILAAKRVGPSGKSIGIDMTEDMLARARRSAQAAGVTNVEFHLAAIDQLPLESSSVDCIISNCVINLAPDKPQVFREIFRVLKPGGRVVISDIALLQPLPPEVAEDITAYVGCIAGAVLVKDYESLLKTAGLESIVITKTGADLNAYAEAGSDCCCALPTDDENDPAINCTAPTVHQISAQHSSNVSLHDGMADVLRKFNANDYAAAVRVHAVKAT